MSGVIDGCVWGMCRVVGVVLVGVVVIKKEGGGCVCVCVCVC